MKVVFAGIAGLIGIMAVLTVIGLAGRGCSVVNEAAQVAQEEFGPRAMLQKYEWFKDVAATLEAKQADIKVYQGRISMLQEDYAGVARKDWPRSDREQMSIWRSEVAGVIASFNGLAAEYNAQMAKFNWSFANAGTLPKGATVPLPREFKRYMEN